MENKRNDLVKQIEESSNTLKKLREKLEVIDYENRFEEANKSLGKYFKEIRTDDFISCFFVYAIDKQDCEFKTLAITYCPDLDEHFHIGYDSQFNPKKWNEEDKFIEITEQEFSEHYKEAFYKMQIALLVEVPEKEVKEIEDKMPYFDMGEDVCNTRLKNLKKDDWKRCLTEELSYEDEYILLMQYRKLQTKNAIDARAAGKGTFGYIHRDVTKEEYGEMEKIYYNNFNKYLELIGQDVDAEWEGIEMENDGGWYFEELEDK